MKITSFEDPRKINQPHPIELLELVVEILEKSPVITSILVRGSIATGKADISSDVDLVLGVHPRALKSFLTNLNSIIHIELGSLFCGWYDKLAPKMGGWGFVYLIPFMNYLYELDIYVVPESTIPTISNKDVLQIYSKSNFSHTHKYNFSTSKLNFDLDKIFNNVSAQNLIIETLTLLHMMSKRVIRQQWLIVYGLSYLINDSMRRFIKNCLVPNSKHWGWYYLEEELSFDPRNLKCLNELSALTRVLPISDYSDIEKVFKHITKIIRIANPELWVKFKTKLEAYKHYMHFK